MNKTTKDTIYVRNEDYELYTNITQNKPEWGHGSNLKLFTTTVLIGKYIVGKRYTGTISHYYLKVKENITKPEINILKSLAVVEHGNYEILEDEKALFRICEEYAVYGLAELIKWYESEEGFSSEIYDEIIEKYNDEIKNFSEH